MKLINDNNQGHIRRYLETSLNPFRERIQLEWLFVAFDLDLSRHAFIYLDNVDATRAATLLTNQLGDHGRRILAHPLQKKIEEMTPVVKRLVEISSPAPARVGFILSVYPEDVRPCSVALTNLAVGQPMGEIHYRQLEHYSKQAWEDRP